MTTYDPALCERLCRLRFRPRKKCDACNGYPNLDPVTGDPGKPCDACFSTGLAAVANLRAMADQLEAAGLRIRDLERDYRGMADAYDRGVAGRSRSDAVVEAVRQRMDARCWSEPGCETCRCGSDWYERKCPITIADLAVRDAYRAALDKAGEP